MGLEGVLCTFHQGCCVLEHVSGEGDDVLLPMGHDGTINRQLGHVEHLSLPNTTPGSIDGEVRQEHREQQCGRATRSPAMWGIFVKSEISPVHIVVSVIPVQNAP